MENFSKLLSSFEVREQLNPKIWDGDKKNPSSCKLKPKVRKGLLKIAEKFSDYLGEDIFIDDIVLTGSLSNFNWSQYSDFDLHLIIDFGQFDEQEEVYKENFNLKKQIFNDKHNVKIYGFDVELYAQDEKESHFSTGVYSIINDDWVEVPKRQEFSLDKELLRKKVKNWISKINHIIDETNNGGQLEKLEDLKEKLKDFRKSGLDKKGELSYENLTFKFLRRSGHIEKLFNYTNKALDKELSIENKFEM